MQDQICYHVSSRKPIKQLKRNFDDRINLSRIRVVIMTALVIKYPWSMPERPLKFCKTNRVTCSIHIGRIWSSHKPQSRGITGFFTSFYPLQCEGCKWCETWRNWEAIFLLATGTNGNIFLPHFTTKKKNGKLKWMLDNHTLYCTISSLRQSEWPSNRSPPRISVYDESSKNKHNHSMESSPVHRLTHYPVWNLDQENPSLWYFYSYLNWDSDKIIIIIT